MIRALFLTGYFFAVPTAALAPPIAWQAGAQTLTDAVNRPTAASPSRTDTATDIARPVSRPASATL